MKYLYLLLLLTATNYLVAQTGYEEAWSVNIAPDAFTTSMACGGIENNAECAKLRTFPNGDLLAAVSVWPTLGSTNVDLQLSRYDVDGNLIWSTQVGSDDGRAEYLADLVISADGGVYALVRVRAGGEKEIAVVHLTGAGDVVYHTTYQYDNLPTMPTSLVVDATGHVYFTGCYNTSPNDEDIVLTKVDPAGNVVWGTSYDSPTSGFHIGRYLELDDQGVRLTSVFHNYSAGWQQTDIARYTTTGALLDQALLTDEVANAFVAEADGARYLAYPGTGQVVKHDAAGAVVWTYDVPQVANAGTDVKALTLGTDGSLYLLLSRVDFQAAYPNPVRLLVQRLSTTGALTASYATPIERSIEGIRMSVTANGYVGVIGTEQLLSNTGTSFNSWGRVLDTNLEPVGVFGETTDRAGGSMVLDDQQRWFLLTQHDDGSPVLRRLNGGFTNANRAETDAFGLTVAPNPARTTVALNTAQPVANVQLFDANGRQVLQQRARTLDVAALATGVYTVSVESVSGDVVRRRLVVQ